MYRQGLVEVEVDWLPMGESFAVTMDSWVVRAAANYFVATLVELGVPRASFLAVREQQGLAGLCP